MSENEKDHERIWLEPLTLGQSHDCRLWCQDKLWPEEEGDAEPTEYVRADLLTAAEARIKMLSEALALLVCDCDHRCNVQPSWPAMSKGCAYARARVVLGPRQALTGASDAG